jgi:hypothetical protein
MPTYVNADIALQMEREGRPWRVLLEFQGYNPGNKSHRSDKWWELRGEGSGLVKCNFGAQGSSGRSTPLTYMVGEAFQKLAEKRAKGYAYIYGTEDTVPRPQSMLDLPSPYRGIKRIVSLGGAEFRALDALGNTVLDMDTEGKDQLVAINPWLPAP